jgi:hypothetical protein
VASVTADFDTRAGERYASGDQILPGGRLVVMVQLSVSWTAVAGRVMVRRLGLPLAVSSLIR